MEEKNGTDNDMMENNRKENGYKRAMLASLMVLAWPTILEQLLETVVQYVDTAMVGYLGADATATVSLSSTYTWMINSVISALGIGFLAYIARGIGEGDKEKVKKAAGQAILVVLAIGLLLTAIILFVAPYMPKWMGADPAIWHDSSMYFIWINIPMVFRAALLIFGAIIRSTGDTKTPMFIHIFVNTLNTFLNYVFIYRIGFGAIGAGIATAIAFTIGGILMTVAFYKNRIIEFEWSYIRISKPILWGCLSIGIPIMLTRIVSCSGYVVATSFVSAMATTIFAAHSIAITAETIFYIPGYGIQAATATLIGNALGENDKRKERTVAFLSIAVIFALMCVSGVALFLGAEIMMGLFTKDALVIEIGAKLLRIVAFTEPIFGTTAVMEGIYNGMGRTKYPFFAEVICRWGVRILGSFLCVNVLGLDVYWIWYCMIADNILKAVLMGINLTKIFSSARKEE